MSQNLLNRPVKTPIFVECQIVTINHAFHPGRTQVAQIGRTSENDTNTHVATHDLNLG